MAKPLRLWAGSCPGTISLRSCQQWGWKPSRTSAEACGPPKCTSAGLNPQSHGLRHLNRSLGSCDGRIHQHTSNAHLHGFRSVRGGSHAGVNDHGHARLMLDLLQNDLKVEWVSDPQSRADGRSQWHDGRCAHIDILCTQPDRP